MVVTFAPAPRLADFAREIGLPIDYRSDVERRAYAALGFARGSVARVWLDPRVWARYAGLIARGGRPRAPGGDEDTLQLGGDVLVDAAGRIEWIHRSTGPEDRPGLGDIVRALGSPP